MQFYVGKSFILGKISRGHFGKLLDISLSCREQCCDRGAAERGQNVAMSASDLLNKTVSSKEAKAPRDLSRPALQLAGMATALEVESSNIPVAKPIERKFTSINNLEQLGVFRAPRIESSISAAIPNNRFARLLDAAKERDGSTGVGQGLEITLIGSMGYFGASRKVSQSAT
jgi:hypothetical protein